jgi:hypothetical protein
MLIVPIRIAVCLKDVRGEALKAPNILIGINFLVNGQYYYGNLIGLTDDRGIATITGAQLEKRFSVDQARFPADYKVSLERCDSDIELFVMAADEVATAWQSVTEDYSVAPEIRDAYACAQNGMMQASLARVPANVTKGEALVVGLTTGIL